MAFFGRGGGFWSVVVGVVMLGCGAGAGERGKVVVDCAKEVGEFRALHGVNGGPVGAQGLVDLSGHFRAAGIPLVRLHDCNWPNADVVDMHAVFPRAEADPAMAESYDFVRTDAYVASVLATGAKVVYRLGESIEHGADKRRVRPPGDPAKWAEQCVGIIRHYNEGWAEGQRHGIEYWEIWNEPDNRPNCWTGTDEEYFQLYAIAAKAIKARFPNVKVGGPGLGSSGELRDGKLKASAFMERFLEHCRREGAPVDFLSWHCYTDRPGELVERAREVRRVLDEKGFARAESHLNEWNYLPDNDWGPVMLAGQGEARQRFYERMGGAEGAAFVASALVMLQGEPVDVSNIFCGGAQGFGLFNEHGAPKRVYHAVKAFNELARAGRRLEVSGGGEVVAGAAVDEGRGEVVVLLSNHGKEAREVEVVLKNWGGRGEAVVRGVGELEERRVEGGGRIVVEMKGAGVWMVRVKRG